MLLLPHFVVFNFYQTFLLVLYDILYVLTLTIWWFLLIILHLIFHGFLNHWLLLIIVFFFDKLLVFINRYTNFIIKIIQGLSFEFFLFLFWKMNIIIFTTCVNENYFKVNTSKTKSVSIQSEHFQIKTHIYPKWALPRQNP